MIVAVLFLFTGCALHNGLTSNLNQHSTEVLLSKKNFQVIAKVDGEAKATYVLGFGGLSKKSLINEARAKMLLSANLVGTTKVIINETVSSRRSFYFLVWTDKVTVSAYVAEFTE